MQAEIRIAAALVLRENGETLLVRKRGTGAFMQPGGKIEPGETPKAALARELREEIGLDIAPSRMAPAAEIEEAVWVPVHAAGALPLAPLTRDNILPLFCQMQFSTELHYGQSRSAETPTLSLSE
ncbi:NUDIX hydrolase [Shinella sp.]|uniref:NUDIX hydrolase n=1 Tax=Shinella sp. TaxID=1870904 RepID=UPI003F6F0C15